ASKKIFVFNNEGMSDPFFKSIPHFKPKSLYSVAAGLKPYALLEVIYKRTKQVTDFHFFDFSEDALDYQRAIREIYSMDELISYLAEKLLKNQLFTTNQSYEELRKIAFEKFHEHLKEFFYNDFEYFRNVIQTVNPSFTKLDIITHPEILIEKIDFNEKFMIWISNIWNTNESLLRMGRKKLDENFMEFVHKLGKEINMNSWASVNKGSHNGFLGKDKNNIHGIITCGHSSIDLNDFRLISNMEKVSLGAISSKHDHLEPLAN
ncbi:MAG: hypothetical protein OXB84_04380, partial [Halobacteriovoraceae bacterium]|nr:hypothetical protein [Halobacteriovoraceae bacterium]